MTEKEKNHPLRSIDTKLQNLLRSILPDSAFQTIDANHLTILGSILVSTGALVELLNSNKPHTEKTRIAAALFVTIGQGIDKLDGVWAKIQKAIGVERDPVSGEIYDTINDRFQEEFFGLMHAIKAWKAHSNLGVLAGLLVMSSSSLSSLARAHAGKNQKEVDEIGSGKLGKLTGTRVARGILLPLGLFVPSIQLQTTIDLLVAAGTAETAIRRMMISLDDSTPLTLEPEDAAINAQKFKALTIAAGIGTAAAGVVGMLYALNSRKSKNGLK